jgi:hypothetical protein
LTGCLPAAHHLVNAASIAVDTLIVCSGAEDVAHQSVEPAEQHTSLSAGSLSAGSRAAHEVQRMWPIKAQSLQSSTLPCLQAQEQHTSLSAGLDIVYVASGSDAGASCKPHAAAQPGPTKHAQHASIAYPLRLRTLAIQEFADCGTLQVRLEAFLLQKRTICGRWQCHAQRCTIHHIVPALV